MPTLPAGIVGRREVLALLPPDVPMTMYRGGEFVLQSDTAVAFLCVASATLASPTTIEWRRTSDGDPPWILLPRGWPHRTYHLCLEQGGGYV